MPRKYLWFENALLPGGWSKNVRISIEHGLIHTLALGAAQAEDERHAIAIPGLANVHSHSFQRGMAGLAEHRGPGDDDFWSWREVMYRFLDRLDPGDLQSIAALAFSEMLETGYTWVGEFHYLHHDPVGKPYTNIAETAASIAAAAATSGIGLTLLPVFYAHSDFGGQAPTSGQRRFIHDVGSFADLMAASSALLTGDSRLGIAPHSLRAVTPRELSELLRLHPDGPVHIHVAEQEKEVAASIAFSGLRPVEWLLEHAGVDRRWCLVHATHITDQECDALAATGAVAGLCPITEANLGDGIFPAQRFLKAGGLIATGTDSNVLIDPAQELRALEYSQRLTSRARNVLASATHFSTGGRLFGAALVGGARALGLESGLAVGNSADIVSLDPQHDALVGRTGDLLLDGWVFAAGRRAVDCVWRRGQRVVTTGQHHAAASIRERYRAVVHKVLAT